MKNSDCIVIIPAYNEENNIAGVVRGVRKAFPGIVVVNDGSSDNTALKAYEAGAEVVSLPFNMGYGVALQTGYKYALENNSEYLIQIDGDGQHDPENIPEFIKAISEDKSLDVVIGSRFLSENSAIPFVRRSGIKFFAGLTSMLTGKKVTDPISGYRIMNRKALEFLVGDMYPEDYPDADLVVIMSRAGFKFGEIPIKVTSNPDGRTMHSGWRPVYYVYKMLLSMLLTMFRSDHKQ